MSYYYYFYYSKGVDDQYAVVLMQGTGTYSLEAVIQQLANQNSNFLIIDNGTYGRKLAEICNKSKIKYHLKTFPENRTIDLKSLECFLKNECTSNQYSNVGIIHSETSSGVLNRVEDIGPLIKKYLPRE